MVRQVKFGDKYSHHDWQLILTRKDIGLPKVKEDYINIPSGDGSIDISEALRGEPSYDDREVSFDFDLLVDPEKQVAIRQELAAYIHGRKLKLVEPDDPNYYYLARLSISEFKLNGWIVKVSIDGTAAPYKYKNELSVYSATIGNGDLVITCTNDRKRVIPTITVSKSCSVSFEGRQYALLEGENRLTNVILSMGENKLVFSGAPNTTVKIEYREGAF
ncbi:hypothetical protein [Jeotgalibaca porci]|uniref:hypothetical protein n=1 Tax=Jeotgalibaca porci TaxID=1868793 RepID=UPI00359FC547